MSNKYPEAAYGSLKEFKSSQRKAIREVLRVIESSDLMCGCAYSPAYRELVEARRLLELAKGKMRVSEWK